MGDLINRQEALGEIKARFEDAREWYRTAKDEDIKARAEATIMSFTECSLMLKRLPSAERVGHWYDKNEGIWNVGMVMACSNCGESFYEMPIICGEPTYNYCPNCGTRMVAKNE